MAQQLIGLGTTANDGTGDSLRAAGEKINENFAEIYTNVGFVSQAFLAQGVDPVSAGTSLDRTYRHTVAAPYAQRLLGVTLWAVAAGNLTVGVWNANDTLAQSFVVRVQAGLNSLVPFDFPDTVVPAGGYITVYGPTVIGLTPSAGTNTTPYRTSTGNATLGTPTWAGTVSTGRLEIGLTFGGATGSPAMERDDLLARLGDVQPEAPFLIGNPLAFQSGSGVSARTTFFAAPFAADAVVTQVQIWPAADGEILLKRATKSGDTYTQVGSDVPVQVTAGSLQAVNLTRPLFVRAGEYLGFFTPTGVVSNGVGTNGQQPAFSDNSGSGGGNVRSFTNASTSTANRAIRFVAREFNQDSAFGRIAAFAESADRRSGDAAFADVPPLGHILVWVLGQSNAAGRAPTRSALELASGHWKFVRSSGELAALADPTGNDSLALTGAGTGSSGPAIGKAIELQSRGLFRAVIVNSAEGGTPLTDVVSPNWSATGTLRTQAAADLAAALTDAATRGIRFSGAVIYFNQGETDADNSRTAAQYIAAFQDFATWARGVIGAKTPILIGRMGRKLAGDTSAYAEIRSAQDTIAATESGVFMPHSASVDFAARSLMIDTWHYNLQGYEEIGLAVGTAAASIGIGVRPSGYSA